VKKHFVRGIIAAVIFKRCIPTLLPYGPAKATSIADFPSYSDVDESIINLTLKSKYKRALPLVALTQLHC
jgi:hypothetical protein